MNAKKLIEGYNLNNISVGVLGGHSALDVAHGAKKWGFKTVCVAQKGREDTYAKYFKTRPYTLRPGRGASGVGRGEVGCIDEVIEVHRFQDISKKAIVDQLRAMNCVFVHNRYFWVYFDEYKKVEEDFTVPIFGSRYLLRLEERDQEFNQYHLLEQADIRIPKVFKKPEDIDRLVIVKAPEEARGYERAFFLATRESYIDEAKERLEAREITEKGLSGARIEEYVIGAPVNFNFFYSPLNHSLRSGSGQALSGLELLGTDMRRQTNLDGFLRMTAEEQRQALKYTSPKMIETGHVAVTVKESLLEKAFEMGEKFVKATQKLPKAIDPSGKGIIGPFALQGAVVTEDGKEDIVIFDVSFRIPGSPGIRATPYSGYLYGESMSVGERIAMELRGAIEQERLEELIT